MVPKAKKIKILPLRENVCASCGRHVKERRHRHRMREFGAKIMKQLGGGENREKHMEEVTVTFVLVGLKCNDNLLYVCITHYKYIFCSYFNCL